MFLFGRKARLHVQALQEVGDVCERVAKGDLNARIVHTDPYGPLAPYLRSLNHMLDQTDAYIRESGASLSFAAEGKFFRPFLERGLHGDFRRGAGIINRARLVMRDKAEETTRLSSEIEAQRVAMAAQAKAERAKLADEFEQGVTAIVEQVAIASREVAVDADTMAGRLTQAGEQSHDVAASAQQATQNTQAVAAAAEQMAATITEISRQLREGNQASKAVNEEAARADAAVQDLVAANRRIDEVVEFIKSVAFQTNLLALNASVEAARAGEAGKGFAVVAQEVRALAQRSANASRDIKQLVQSSSTQTKRGVELVNRAGKAVVDIGKSISAVAETVREISSASQEQAVGLREVSNAFNHLDTMTQQNAALVEETHAASQSLASQAQDLAELVEFFRMWDANERRIERRDECGPDDHVILHGTRIPLRNWSATGAYFGPMDEMPALQSEMSVRVVIDRPNLKIAYDVEGTVVRAKNNNVAITYRNLPQDLRKRIHELIG